MNRTIKEKARTLLLGVEADQSLWTEATVTAAHLHNLMLVNGKDKTPFEKFTGRVPDDSNSRKWGCLAYVKRENHQVSTMGAQSVLGMLVGFDKHTKGYRVRVGDRILVSRNVHFVEHKSGASVIGRAAKPSASGEAAYPDSNDQHEEHDASSPDDNGISPFATPNPFELLHIPDGDNNEDVLPTNHDNMETTTPSCPTIPEETTADNLGPQPQNLDQPTPCVPVVLNRLITSARDVTAALPQALERDFDHVKC